MFLRAAHVARQCGCGTLIRSCSSDASSQTPRMKSYPVLTGERGVNKVTLIGRVGRDPEIRGDEQNPVAIFPLATSQSFRQEDGTYNQFTEWHRIVVFRRALGQIIASTVKRGDKVYVAGSIHYNRIPDKETNKPVTIAQIRADDVMPFSKRPTNMPEQDSPEER